ncbi:MAG TPA: hypothetical protein VKF37_12945 [Chloroflexota bacterium]|nr:hypothetical protein [Chloroflexota bacterium]
MPLRDLDCRLGVQLLPNLRPCAVLPKAQMADPHDHVEAVA